MTYDLSKPKVEYELDPPSVSIWIHNIGPFRISRRAEADLLYVSLRNAIKAVWGETK